MTRALRDGARYLDVRYFGAVPDGKTDNWQAITDAFAEAREQELPLFVPPGEFAYDGVLKLNSVRFFGAGDASALLALNPHAAAIYVLGQGAAVQHMRLTGPPTDAERWANYEGKRIVVRDEASDWLLEGLLIDQGIGCGIQCSINVTRGRILRNRIRDTLADAIHLSDGANHIEVDGNRVDHTGDDGVAVVSVIHEKYEPVHHITARRNVIRNQWGGRGMTVVGGEFVLYENNEIHDNRNAAGIYIASESSYTTVAPRNVVVRNNLVRQCGNPDKGHYAVLVYGREGYVAENITLQRNAVMSDYYGGINVRMEFVQGALVDQNLVKADPDLKVTSEAAIVNPYTEGPVGVRT